MSQMLESLDRIIFCLQFLEGFGCMFEASGCGGNPRGIRIVASVIVVAQEECVVQVPFEFLSLPVGFHLFPEFCSLDSGLA